MPPKKAQAPTKAASIPDGPPSRPIAFLEWTLLPSAIKPPTPPQLSGAVDATGAPPGNSSIIPDDSSLRVDEDLAPLTGNTEARLVGRLEIELMTDLVPRACENFKQFCLGATVHGDKKAKQSEAKQLSYKDTTLLRATDYMIQCGDVSHRADGKGSDSIHGGAIFDDEHLGAVSHNQRGVVSYANAGPNTNGSQFCITLKECRYLDSHLVSFGRLMATEQNEQTLALIEEIVNEVKEGVADLAEAAVAAEAEDAEAAADAAAATSSLRSAAPPFGYYDAATSRFNPADCPLVISACGITDQTVLVQAK